MTKSITLALAALAGLAAPLSATAQADAPQLTKGEMKLAEMLEGRVPGEPESCLSRRAQRDDIEVIDGTALVFGRGKTIWVSVPRRPASLDDRDILVTRTFGSQLCTSDVISTLDSSGHFYNGNIFLGEFVPYTRMD